MLPLATGLLVAIATGFLALWALWPAGAEGSLSDLSLLFFLSCGFAFGISSITFFFLLIMNGRNHVVFADIIVGALIAGAPLRRLNSRAKRTQAPAPLPHRPAWGNAILWIVPAAFCLALAACSYLLVGLSTVEPHGGWDAWAIWNARARFLFRAGNQWRDAFSGVLIWSHVGYPLLLPATNAHLWSYAGRDDVRGPIAVALILTLATVGLAVCSLCRLRTRTQGFLAGLVLSATNLFVERAPANTRMFL